MTEKAKKRRRAPLAERVAHKKSRLLGVVIYSRKQKHRGQQPA